ncbi:MBL fold metallo-hydrolase [Photobacterium sp. MCCC 1A19761]|uniref:MBL fold metallo-hydrolase n=1 Tax=Photobacterium sp. MCCC 1A19761 TaxID=3115000 RepID=UPI00307E7BEE
MKAQVHAFYHQDTSTLSYIVFDQPGGHAIVIDSVLDFSLSSGSVGTKFSDGLIAFLQEHQLTLDWILETHAHADHLSAASYLKRQVGGKIGVGKGITEVQKVFGELFAIPQARFSSGEDGFDHLFEDNEVFSFGSLTGHVLATPGHTSDSVTYVIDGNAFVGDTVFMPDFGTARCDFPGGDAAMLFDSITRIYALPDETRIWVCHDYQPGGRALEYQTTVAESKANNIHLQQHTTKLDFIHFREQRDHQLEVPKLLYPSVQVNILAGQLPEHFFKIPVREM